MEEDSSQIARPKHHQGPDVSLEALTHIARLLASVPSSLTSEIYFEQLAPQMFSLLDGEAGPEMTKVAGYVIGSGILGRKATGAPGTAGWRSYVTPILSSIDPTMHVRTHPPMQGSLLVRHDDLQLALCRLCTLLSSHPNPNLTKRLLGPLLLPLWAISSSMDVSDPRSSSNLSKSLLHMYLRIAADVRKFTMLASHLLYNGKLATSEDIGWRYRAIGSDGVEIRVVPKGERSMNDLVQDLADVDGRVAFFNQLIKTDVVEKDQRGALFLAITRRWLGTTQTAHAEDSNMHVAGLLSGPVPKAIDDPLQSATYAKLTQTMLVDMQENLQENTIQMLEFVRQLLQSFVEGRRQRQLDADRLKNPSLTAIGSIVRHPEAHLSSGEGGRSGEVTTTDSVELLSMALSLLSAVLSSKELHVSREEEGILECLEPSLTYVSRVSDLPASTKATASSLLGLIDLMSSSLIPKSSTTTVSPSLVEDRKTQSLALTYLADNLPPVRAEGLSLLSSLIRSSSPIIDVSATATLLISILQDADEFIHLNAIKVLVYLADKHSRTVTKLLLEQYVDSREALTLDQRLRLGEALQQTAQRLGEAFAGDAAKVVGEGCLQLAGRRGRKPKTAQVKAKRRELDEQRKQEAAEAWGGEVPQVGDEAPQDEEGEEKEILAKILEGWEGSDAEEDVRIRASAVSVFGAAMEANIAGLGSTLSSTGIDLAMSILTLEKSDDKAILRRAAILLILSLVHSLDQAREQQKKLGFGLAGENLQDVVTVLRYVHATDGDTLVQQHAGTAIEELEAWQAKHLLGVSSSEREEAISQTEVIGDRIVGLPMLLRPGGDGPSKIEEIE
ncbi:MAG: hypothetical protein M1838_003425 [Thelocarpon superellum]|nr:MAG: hypothetical protein M1838_003425 [Thelocarpon superellum]